MLQWLLIAHRYHQFVQSGQELRTLYAHISLFLLISISRILRIGDWKNKRYDFEMINHSGTYRMSRTHHYLLWTKMDYLLTHIHFYFKVIDTYLRWFKLRYETSSRMKNLTGLSRSVKSKYLLFIKNVTLVPSSACKISSKSCHSP